MYGKSYESKYTGSMMGAGFNVFAVWDYVITNTHFGVIELNPKLVAFTLAGTRPGAVKEVEEAIGYLCRVDPESRSKAEAGRKMVKEGEYQYRVVNWDYYQGLRDAAAQRKYNREAKRRERASKKDKPLPGEAAAVAAMERGDQNGADAITTAALPAVPLGSKSGEKRADLPDRWARAQQASEEDVPRGKGLSPTPAGPPAESPALGGGTGHPPPCNPEAGRPDPRRSSSAEEEELTYPDGEPLG